MPHIKNSIARWLSEIQQAIKEHTEAAKKHYQAEIRERQQHAQSETQAVVRLPVEVTEYYRSEQSDRPIKDRRDKIRLGLEIVGIIIALGLAGLTLCSLSVLNGQLKEMQRQTEISERPWLSVAVSPHSNLMFVDGKAVLTVRVSATNVGKSIAKDIVLKSNMYPASSPIDLSVRENQLALCNNPKFAPGNIGSFDLFPTDRPYDNDVSPSVPFDKVPPGEHRFVNFYVVGCLSYHSSFGTAIHQTRFAYNVYGPPVFGPDHKLLGQGFEVGTEVPKEALAMAQNILGYNDAN